MIWIPTRYDNDSCVASLSGYLDIPLSSGIDSSVD